MKMTRYYILNRYGDRHVTRSESAADALIDLGWWLVDVKDYYG
jgi:hypothetical protein